MARCVTLLPLLVNSVVVHNLPTTMSAQTAITMHTALPNNPIALVLLTAVRSGPPARKLSKRVAMAIAFPALAKRWESRGYRNDVPVRCMTIHVQPPMRPSRRPNARATSLVTRLLRDLHLAHLPSQSYVLLRE